VRTLLDFTTEPSHVIMDELFQVYLLYWLH